MLQHQNYHLHKIEEILGVVQPEWVPIRMGEKTLLRLVAGSMMPDQKYM
jgi:hypothetical protein